MKSASNRQMTLLRKLGRKKYRQKEQLYLLEGARAVQQVIQNNMQAIKALFFDQEQYLWEHKEWLEIRQQVDSFSLTQTVFEEVSDTDHPQGVLALCHMPDETPAEELADQNNLLVALDAIQDPGNLGTIIRTCVWFGAGGIISGKGTVDLFHPKVVRSTAGATGRLPYQNADLQQVLPVLEQAGWPVYLLDAGADSVSLASIEPGDKAVIVIGNEAHGLQQDVMTGNRTKVRISSPRDKPEVESLNAGVATSIALYEFYQKLPSPGLKE